MLTERPYTAPELVKGRYRMKVRFKKAQFIATFGIAALPATLFLSWGADKIADDFVGVKLRLPVVNKEYFIHSIQKTPAGLEEIWTLDFTLLQNPVPIGVVLGAIAVLAGLSLIFLTVSEVNEVIKSPVGAAAVGIVLLLILGGVVVWFRSS